MRQKPVPPGQILLLEFLRPDGISQNELARAIGVPPPRINAIIKGNRTITTDTALRLGRYFGTKPEIWLGLQNHYDLTILRQRLADQLKAIKPLKKAKRK